MCTALASVTECASDSTSSHRVCGAQRISPAGTWLAATRRSTTCCTWSRCTRSGAGAPRRACRRMRHTIAPSLRRIADRLCSCACPSAELARRYKKEFARCVLRAQKAPSPHPLARRYKKIVDEYIDQQKKVSSARMQHSHAELATDAAPSMRPRRRSVGELPPRLMSRSSLLRRSAVFPRRRHERLSSACALVISRHFDLTPIRCVSPCPPP